MMKTQKTIMVLYDNCLTDAKSVRPSRSKKRICHVTPLTHHQASPLFRWGLIQNETLWILHNRFVADRSVMASDAVDRSFSSKPAQG